MSLIILFSKCIEPFDLSINKYENLLVIDGLISDATGPYTVKISESSATDNININNVSYATVIISDDKGNSETLSETENGVYTTSENGIQGIINNSYKIYVKTRDGNEYESEFQKLLPGFSIDSLYGNVDFQTTDNSNLIHEGYQFFIETYNITNEPQYILWEPIETYQYNAEYYIEYWYHDGIVESYPRPDSFYTCWKTERIQDVFVLKSENNNDYIQFPLNFTSADNSKRLGIKYSLLVKQYNIGYDAYRYWHSVREILDQGQSLYNIQPFQIPGNIKNINDSEETVLGYFTVAGVSEKRIFKDPIPPSYYIDPYCVPSTRVWETITNYPSDFTLYAVTGIDGRVGVVWGKCIFCTAEGGTITKPDFWIDE